MFRALASEDHPSTYSSPANGGNPTSPVTDDLDHAVATYLAAYPMTTGKPDLVRQELAKVPFDQVMAGLAYHKNYIWRSKADRWIPKPENFLINGTWNNRRRSGSSTGLTQRNDDCRDDDREMAFE
jgi:hypothetical protein